MTTSKKKNAKFLKSLEECDVLYIGKAELDKWIPAAQSLVSRLIDRRRELGVNSLQPSVARSQNSITERDLREVAKTLPTLNLFKIAWHTLELNTLDIAFQLKQVPDLNVCSAIEEGINLWMSQNKRCNTADALKRLMGRAAAEGLIDHQSLINTFDGGRINFIIITRCFIPSKWSLFALKYLKIISLIDMEDEQAFVHELSMAILRLWTETSPRKTKKDLHTKLDQARDQRLMSPLQTANVPSAVWSAQYSSRESDPTLRNFTIHSGSDCVYTSMSQASRSTVVTMIEQPESDYTSLNRSQPTAPAAPPRNATKFVIINQAKEVCVFDQSSSKWQKAATLPSWVDEHTAICSTGDGTLVCVGAGEQDNGCNVTKIHISDDLSSHTSSMLSLNEPVKDATVLVNDEMLFVVGGTLHSSDTEDASYLTTPLYLLLQGNASANWMEMAKLEKAVYNSVVIAKHDKLYAVGGDMIGIENSFTVGRYLQIYDSVTSQCRETEAAPDTCDTKTNGGVLYDDKITVFTQYLVQEYDTDQDEWTLKTHNIHKVSNIKPAVCNEELYVCVQGKKSASYNIYQYDMEIQQAIDTYIDVPPLWRSRDFYSI